MKTYTQEASQVICMYGLELAWLQLMTAIRV